MALTPLSEVEVRRAIKGGRVTVEQIRHNNEVSVRCELIGNELGVDETMANDVGKDEDCVHCTLVFRISEIGFDFVIGKSLFSRCSLTRWLGVATYCRHL